MRSGQYLGRSFLAVPPLLEITIAFQTFFFFFGSLELFESTINSPIQVLLRGWFGSLACSSASRHVKETSEQCTPAVSA